MYLDVIVEQNGQIIKAVWHETGDPVNLVFDLKTEVAGQERCLISLDDATKNEIVAASASIPEKSKLVYIVNNFLVDMTQEIPAAGVIPQAGPSMESMIVDMTQEIAAAGVIPQGMKMRTLIRK